MKMQFTPVEVEQLVIGQVLYSKDVITRAAQILKPEHFSDTRCGEVFSACLDLWRNDTGVDLVTVYTEMKRRGKIATGEGVFTLANYTYRVAQTVNFEDHAGIVLDNYRKRVLMDASEAIVMGLEGSADTTAVISQMSADIEAATIAAQETDVSGADVAYELMNNTDRPEPIYLGMGLLDEYLFILPGNVITIKGAPGSGKTAFVLSAVLNLLPKVSTWMVSLEMHPNELMTRALCQLAQTDIDLALIDRLTPEDKERMAVAANNYAPMLERLRIEPIETMHIDTFRAKADHMVRRRGVGLIVLDYAQLLDADHKRYPNQTQQLEAISKGIRATARRLDVPILVVVHISKSGEEHGTIQFEKDAHARIALEADAKGERYVSLLKNRNGRTAFQLGIPSKMRHGMVGRTRPPDWAPENVVSARTSPTPVPHPDNRTEPKKDTDEIAPF